LLLNNLANPETLIRVFAQARVALSKQLYVSGRVAQLAEQLTLNYRMNRRHFNG